MSETPTYPAGTVRALLAGDQVTAKTREVLEVRLAAPAVTEPAFFDAQAFALLIAVCDRLVPQDGPERVDIAGAIDEGLAHGAGNGWRYDALPADGEALRAGLSAVDETARTLFGGGFLDLSADGRDAVLTRVEGGDPPGEGWRALSAFRWFEELLVEAAEVYYAHPLASEEIGYVGMADAPGWTRIGLDEREAREPAPEAHGAV